MELSFYGWLWMIVGAVFVPMEVIAYIASIIKVVLDRYRIKKTITARRQSKLSGIPSGKRINIMIITDEARVFRFMSNGHCQNNNKSISDPASPSNNAEDSAESDEHKQNGGHSVIVAVEYNLEVRSLSGDIAMINHSQILKENSFKKITAAKRSITIDGENLTNYAGFCDGSSNMGIVSNSGTCISDADDISGKTISSSSISLPDLYPNKQNKQPPPKPKRNNPCAINKKASITETDKVSNNLQAPDIETDNSLAKDNSSISGCQDVPTSNSDKISSLSVDHVQGSGRYSATSATDTDGQVIHASPNRSRSEDCLLGSSQEVHLTKSSSQGDVNTGQIGGHANVAFTDSSWEMKTAL